MNNKNNNNTPQKGEQPKQTALSGIIVSISWAILVIMQSIFVVLKLSGPLSQIPWLWLFFPTFFAIGAYLALLITSLLTLAISSKKLTKANKEQLNAMVNARLVQQDMMQTLTNAVQQYLNDEERVFASAQDDLVHNLQNFVNAVNARLAAYEGVDSGEDHLAAATPIIPTSTDLPFAALNGTNINSCVFQARKQLRNQLQSQKIDYSTIVSTDQEGVDAANFWMRNQFKDSAVIPEVEMHYGESNSTTAIWKFSSVMAPGHEEERDQYHLCPVQTIPVSKGSILMRSGNDITLVTLESYNHIGLFQLPHETTTTTNENTQEGETQDGSIDSTNQ